MEEELDVLAHLVRGRARIRVEVRVRIRVRLGLGVRNELGTPLT